MNTTTTTDALTQELWLTMDNDRDHHFWMRDLAREVLEKSSAGAVTALEDRLESWALDTVDELAVPGPLGWLLSKAVGLVDFREIAEDLVDELTTDN